MKQLSVKSESRERRDVEIVSGSSTKRGRRKMEAADKGLKSFSHSIPFRNYQLPWTFYLPLWSRSQHELTFYCFLGDDCS